MGKFLVISSLLHSAWPKWVGLIEQDMPTVSTQTQWSWLQDLHEIARLTALGGEFSIEVERWEQDMGKSEERGCSVDTISLPVSAKDVHSPEAVPEEHHTDAEPEEESGGISPTTHQESADAPPEIVHDFKLPEIASASKHNGRTSTCSCEQEAEHSSDPEGIQLPALVKTLEFPSGSEASSSDEEEGSCEEGSAPKFPDIQLTNLPLPTILQYLRETESLASEYFSLGSEPKPGPQRKGLATPSEKRETETSGRVGGGVFLPRPGDGITCDFCGQVVPRHSFLKPIGSSSEDSPFCCEEYKEFCILAATCMQQMVLRMTQEKPKRIAIKPGRKAIRKTAQERAFAMLRRKKKWEELQRKKKQNLQSSSFYSLTKQTKTIQFSLLSPAIHHTGWMVRPESGLRKPSHRKRRKRNHDKLLVMKGGRGSGLMPPELLERLTQNVIPLGSLDVRKYSSGQGFATLLPGRTGQCYYPSGRIAILAFSMYPGVLGYLVYEDNNYWQILGCADELGRACCYNTDGSMRLLLSPSTGIVFDHHGSLKRKWVWKSQTSSPLFQPITVPLNRHISLRCSGQDHIVLTFSVQQEHIKFTLSRRIKDDSLLVLEQPLPRVQALENHLQRTQSRISHLLEGLQQTQRVQRLTELRSVYAPRRTNSDAHKRTRSTGALNLQRPPITHTTFTRPLV